MAKTLSLEEISLSLLKSVELSRFPCLYKHSPEIEYQDLLDFSSEETSSRQRVLSRGLVLDKSYKTFFSDNCEEPQKCHWSCVPFLIYADLHFCDPKSHPLFRYSHREPLCHKVSLNLALLPSYHRPAEVFSLSNEAETLDSLNSLQKGLHYLSCREGNLSGNPLPDALSPFHLVDYTNNPEDPKLSLSRSTFYLDRPYSGFSLPSLQEFGRFIDHQLNFYYAFLEYFRDCLASEENQSSLFFK